MTLKIGLAVEGPTDFIVLRELLAAYANLINDEIQVKFVELQPSPDATTGSPEGGWSALYQWCVRNSPAARANLFFGEELFANGLDSKKCDVILIVMDADVCEHLEDKAPNVVVPDDLTCIYAKGTYVKAVIHSWLWPDGASPDDHHIIAPAVEMLEAWLVAALSEEKNPETLSDPLRRLAEIEYEIRGRQCPVTMKSIPKQKKRYEPLAIKAKENIKTIIETCQWFSFISEQIGSHFIMKDT